MFLHYAFSHISWAIFFIIPLITFFLKLLYWRKKNYTEHLIFILHLHAFLFAILTLLMTWLYFQEKTNIGHWPSVISLYIIGYSFFALKTVYEASFWGSIFRLFLFIISYIMAGSTALLFLALLSFAFF